jgi:hypothetical protein
VTFTTKHPIFFGYAEGFLSPVFVNRIGLNVYINLIITRKCLVINIICCIFTVLNNSKTPNYYELDQRKIRSYHT